MPPDSGTASASGNGGSSPSSPGLGPGPNSRDDPVGTIPSLRNLRIRTTTSGQSRRGRVMSVIDFFEYLAASDHTVDLAHELADVWVARQMFDVYQPAA